MELDLECVASFLLLCEEGHFGRASSRLHLTSSALTKRVQRLEHQLGAQLVVRDPSGASTLTGAGWQFLPRAKVLLDLARSAQDVARAAISAPVREIVRVGVPGVLASDPAMAALSRPMRSLREWIPGTVIQCIGVPYGRVIDSLLSRKVDVLWSPSAIDHPALECRSLGTALRVGIVPNQHPLANSASVDVESFCSLPLLYNRDVPADLMTPGWLGDVRPRSKAQLVVTEVQGIAALKKAVLQGQGMAVLPALIGRNIGMGLKPLSLTGAPPVGIYALYRRTWSSDLASKVLDLLELVASPENENHFPMKIEGLTAYSRKPGSIVVESIMKSWEAAPGG